MMDKRTYVLVHGAWHGGWCWNRVADRLAAAGHRVFTPTQTGLGERKHLLSAAITPDTFIDDIVNVIDAEELDGVILVGHSFGGRSIAGVADRMPERLRRLVFLDAGLPESGKSNFEQLAPEVRDARIKAAQDFSGGLSMPPPKAAAFGVTDPADAAWLERRLTPHPFATYSLPLVLKNPIANGVPATYIRCVAPAYPNTAKSAEYAHSRADWQYLEIRTGHDAMVTAPAGLAEMLLAVG
ncbi:MAG: alpha/beta fold hydrolase [Rhizobiales bacterium]|nr:alpha/beta fold hydrolase [Hyphomicrobiales bacterium]